ncbi:MAG TPA: TIGR03619 family F420-dependent LLM class oxidoreductase [Patescibacteria group bacterium]|nr:TIGR03619 family F420-dependent LLM class oxidoreductase [Patescibacteria group bacterium]
MKFGVVYNTATRGVDPDAIVATARHAELCGFESIYLPEHVVLHAGAALGGVAIDPAVPIIDPLVGLSFVAAATDRILLGTAVLQLPYHHPVTLAKRLATLDVLSKGRLRLLTVGLGSLSGEASAVGVDYPSRGRRADETIDVLRLLWAGEDSGVSHHGEFFAFDNLVSFPKPARERTLPIHVGGSSRAAARRAGLRGDGYFQGGAMSNVERAAQIELMRSTAIAAGRDPDKLEVTRWGSTDMSFEKLEAYRAGGVTRVVVGAGSLDLPQSLDELSAFAERFKLR